MVEPFERVLELLNDQDRAVKPGLGKFERCEDERLGRALYEASLDHSNLDDQLGSVDGEGYWIGLMDRCVAWEDPQGFFEYELHDTPEEARLAFLGQQPEEE